MFDLREEQERVILVGVQENGGANAEESLDELAELASTAGAKVEGRLVQVREAIHPGTYIGKGKLEELKILVRACDATGIICDDELSSIQLKGLEEALECKIMDRTLLILDIFAARAVSSEGKIQVVRPDFPALAHRFPVSAAESVREDRERKSWKPTGA